MLLFWKEGFSAVLGLVDIFGGYELVLMKEFRVEKSSVFLALMKT
jgi:hypothetical protein